MTQFNEAEYNKDRLELYTFNGQKIEKVAISSSVINHIQTKYIDKLGNSVSYELFSYYMKHIQHLLNETLALVVLPHFTNVFTTNQKIKAEHTENGGLKFTKDQFGFLIHDYTTIADFLAEPTGALVPDKSFFELRYYENTMKDSLRKAFNLNFQYLESVFYEEQAPDQSKMISLSLDEMKDELIEELVVDIYQTISKMPIDALFNLYGLSDEKQKLEQAKEDDVLFRKQFDALNHFIDSFRNNATKKIIIKTREPVGGNIDSCDFYFTPNNEIQTKEGACGEALFKHFLNKTLYNFDSPGSIIVQEETAIKDSNGEPQLKVCGMMIKHREFLPIDKETLREMYKRVMEINNAKDANNYRFFEWLYDYIPDFTD